MATKKTAKKKAAAKKTAKKTAKKSTAKKSTAKKSTAKKSTAKKSTAKKSTAKNAAAKKTAAKKTAAKKTAAKKTAAKKTAAKKSTAKKSTAKKKPLAPLAHRLGVKGGVFHIDNPPHGFELLVPPGVEIGMDLPDRLGAIDAVLAFVEDRSQLEYLGERLESAWPKMANVRGEVLLWIAYPTGSDDVGDAAFAEVLAPLKLTADMQRPVDDRWTASRLRDLTKIKRLR